MRIVLLTKKSILLLRKKETDFLSQKKRKSAAFFNVQEFIPRNSAVPRGAAGEDFEIFLLLLCAVKVLEKKLIFFRNDPRSDSLRKFIPRDFSQIRRWVFFLNAVPKQRSLKSHRKIDELSKL